MKTVNARPYSGRAFRVFIAMLLVFTFVATYLASATSAQALEVGKVTVKSNEDGGNGVLAGSPTRVTLEATVSEGEDVQSMSVQFPDGTDLSQTSVVATVLEGLDRKEANETTQVSGASTVDVSFGEPLAAGTLIRLEFYSTSLPAGTATLTGTYTTSTGTTNAITSTGDTEVTANSLTNKIVAWLDTQSWVDAWNSNTFLHLFFSPQLIVSSIPTLFWGWLQALALVALAFPLAIPLGLLLSFMRMSKVKVLRGIASFYINIVRGTPLFLQMYIAFFGLPLLGIIMGNYLLGVLVMAFNSAAYLAEIFRAGIQSIHKGQMEAARSLGMNGAQAMVYVIIPQAVRRVIPTMTSEFILLYKDTSLLAAVGVMETMMYAKTLTAATGNVTPYIVAAGYYLVVTLPLTKVAGNFERKLAAADGQPSGDKPRKHRKNRNGGKGEPLVENVNGNANAIAEETVPELSSAVHGSM